MFIKVKRRQMFYIKKYIYNCLISLLSVYYKVYRYIMTILKAIKTFTLYTKTKIIFNINKGIALFLSFLNMGKYKSH